MSNTKQEQSWEDTTEEATAVQKTNKKTLLHVGSLQKSTWMFYLQNILWTDESYVKLLGRNTQPCVEENGTAHQHQNLIILRLSCILLASCWLRRSDHTLWPNYAEIQVISNGSHTLPCNCTLKKIKQRYVLARSFSFWLITWEFPKTTVSLNSLTKPHRLFCEISFW